MFKLTLNDIRQIAQLKNGKCLSKEYINASSPLQWMCAKGHTWDAPYTIIKQGGWCSQCAKDEVKSAYLHRMQKIAQAKGGVCLSTEYINSSTHLLFKCKNGHTWKAVPQNVYQGNWCKQCAGSSPLTLQKFQQIAKAKQGKCISKEYVNKDSFLQFQCKQGHQWQATPRNIIAGTWCPQCRKSSKTDLYKAEAEKIKQKFFAVNKQFSDKTLSKGGGIELMQKFAEWRGGKCLSTQYLHSRVKLQWQCSKGHKWDTAPELIAAGNWCPSCGGSKQGSIEIMQQLARKKGGKCLSKKYIGSQEMLTWQCAKGHVWESTASHIKRGSWCHQCSGMVKISIEKLQQHAISKNGKCLSTVYNGRHDKIKWQCSIGHRWQSSWAHVSRGSWCPQCGAVKGSITRRKFLNEEQQVK